MARRRGRRHRGRKGIPVLSLLIAGGQVAAAAAESGGDWKTGLNVFQSYYTGVSFLHRAFVPQNLIIGWGPWVAKGFIGKIARGVGARPRLFPGLSLS